MLRLQLCQTSLTLPGRFAPFSLGALLPAPCLSRPTQVLNNVCLDVSDGERIALAGAAGQGRSSLLRLLDGRLAPTAGSCQINGSVAAVMDLQRDLDPDETGRHNLDRLLGRRAGEAAELTGLGELLDVPVGFCSPGMAWRIGFAAAAWPADVLLVDDCLGAADLAFRSVALARLAQLLERAKAAVVAEPALFARCSRTVVLADGRLLEGCQAREAA
jgi:ABC-type polysaccharide/polyol phosphate transport system ATPase subunit